MKTIFITVAASGIGKETTTYVSRQGRPGMVTMRNWKKEKKGTAFRLIRHSTAPNHIRLRAVFQS